MIKPNKPQAYRLIHEGLLALSRSSAYGMRIDIEYCKKMHKILDKKIKKNKRSFMESRMGRLWSKVYRSPNLNSNKQLSNILYDKLKAPVKKKTDKGAPSTDYDSLEDLKQDFPELKYFSAYTKLSKVQGTYIDGIIKETTNGILRPSFSLHIPVTFRSSSQNINFQNIPNRDKKIKNMVRKAFIPRLGNQFLTADFSGIEVCLSCCNHKDPVMIEYVKHPEKNNMHTDMAIQLYMLNHFKKEGTEKTLRKGAKNGFVFPQFYGDYYGNNAISLCQWAKLPTQGKWAKNDGLVLSCGTPLGDHFRNKGIKSFDDFLDHVQGVEEDFWGNRFKVYGNWKKKMVRNYYKKGELHMLTGFTCSGLLSKNDITNYPIQGPAFHCLLKTFIKLDEEIRKRKLKSRLIGQIHDELVLDAYPPEVETLKSLIKWIACEWLLEEWPWIIVPMEIEASVYPINGTWAEDSEVTVLRA